MAAKIEARSYFYTEFPSCPLRLGRSGLILLLFILNWGSSCLSNPNAEKQLGIGVLPNLGPLWAWAPLPVMWLCWRTARSLVLQRNATALAAAAQGCSHSSTGCEWDWLCRQSGDRHQQSRLIHQPWFSLTPLISDGGDQGTRGMSQGSCLWHGLFSHIQMYVIWVQYDHLYEFLRGKKKKGKLDLSLIMRETSLWRWRCRVSILYAGFVFN